MSNNYRKSSPGHLACTYQDCKNQGQAYDKDVVAVVAAKDILNLSVAELTSFYKNWVDVPDLAVAAEDALA